LVSSWSGISLFYYYYFFEHWTISVAEIGNDSGSRMRLETHRFSPRSLVTSRTFLVPRLLYVCVCVCVVGVDTRAAVQFPMMHTRVPYQTLVSAPGPAVILIIRTAVKIYRSMGIYMREATGSTRYGRVVHEDKQQLL